MDSNLVRKCPVSVITMPLNAEICNGHGTFPDKFSISAPRFPTRPFRLILARVARACTRESGDRGARPFAPSAASRTPQPRKKRAGRQAVGPTKRAHEVTLVGKANGHGNLRRWLAGAQ
jgi:hypothetical protein